MPALGSGSACSPRPSFLLSRLVASSALRSTDVFRSIPSFLNGLDCGPSDSPGSGVYPGHMSLLIWARIGWPHSDHPFERGGG